jgi:flagellar biosynthetic protein FliQ
MTITTVLEIAKHALFVGMQASMPLLLVSLIIGTLVGVLQAATQVQEFTLTFVPKLLGLALVLLLVGPWMLQCLVSFSTMMLQQIPSMAR